MITKVWDAMSSSDAVLYVRSKLQQSRHRHQLPLSAVSGDDDANEDRHHDNSQLGFFSGWLEVGHGICTRTPEPGCDDGVDADGLKTLITTKAEKYTEASVGTLWNIKLGICFEKVCEDLLDTCCTKTVDKFGKNSCDNMTVILILPGENFLSSLSLFINFIIILISTISRSSWRRVRYKQLSPLLRCVKVMVVLVMMMVVMMVVVVSKSKVIDKR